MENVKRIMLDGNWTTITFHAKNRYFFVKNFTDANVYVSFIEDDEENSSIKITKGMGEIVAKAFISGANTLTNTIYVKGTGEVEIQAMDIV